MRIIYLTLLIIGFCSCHKKGSVDGHIVNYLTGEPIEGVKISVQEYHIIGTGDFGIERQKIVENATSDKNGEFILQMKYRRRDKFEYRLYLDQQYVPIPETDVDVFYFTKTADEQLRFLEKTKREDLKMELRPTARLRLVCNDVEPPDEIYSVNASLRDDAMQTWVPFGSNSENQYYRVATNGLVHIRIDVMSNVYRPSYFDSILLPPFSKATYTFNY